MSIPMEMITSDNNLTEAGFYWRETGGVRALVCAPLEEDGFVNGFSTRLGGVSDMPANALSLGGFHDDAAENILENRRRFLKLFPRSEEHTSELQSRRDLVCRLLLEKKKEYK